MGLRTIRDRNIIRSPFLSDSRNNFYVSCYKTFKTRSLLGEKYDTDPLSTSIYTIIGENSNICDSIKSIFRSILYFRVQNLSSCQLVDEDDIMDKYVKQIYLGNGNTEPLLNIVDIFKLLLACIFINKFYWVVIRPEPINLSDISLRDVMITIKESYTECLSHDQLVALEEYSYSDIQNDGNWKNLDSVFEAFLLNEILQTKSIVSK